MKILKNDIYRKIDEAFDFYGINEKYKKMCYDCIEGNTKLQRKIKQELLNNREFYMGLGALKNLSKD